ncbi:MAG: NADH-quinone oxidoreductase subunit J [Saprospiraceae bacterium]|nr:NADH-quinone oxidoreductase subunit J [Lewinellaceae bacterium]
MEQYLFYTLAAITIMTSLLMVFTKNPVHSVIYLIITFFLIAGQYVLLNAQFLAVVHIIVYAGAIMVLFLFVLMLLNLNEDTEPRASAMWKLMAGIGSGSLLITFVGAFRGSIQVNIPEQGNPKIGLVENLGRVLFRDFVVPFEIAGILFLAAMVGAVLVGKKENKL